MKMMLFSKLQLMQILKSRITSKLENTQGEEVQHKALQISTRSAAAGSQKLL